MVTGAAVAGQDFVMAERVARNALENNNKKHLGKDDNGKEELDEEEEGTLWDKVVGLFDPPSPNSTRHKDTYYNQAEEALNAHMKEVAKAAAPVMSELNKFSEAREKVQNFHVWQNPQDLTSADYIRAATTYGVDVVAGTQIRMLEGLGGLSEIIAPFTDAATEVVRTGVRRLTRICTGDRVLTLILGDYTAVIVSLGVGPKKFMLAGDIIRGSRAVLKAEQQAVKEIAKVQKQAAELMKTSTPVKEAPALKPKSNATPQQPATKQSAVAPITRQEGVPAPPAAVKKTTHAPQQSPANVRGGGRKTHMILSKLLS